MPDSRPPAPHVPPAQGAPVRDTEAASAADAPAPRRTLLLVEDEPGVRATARRLLQRGGYDVVEAGHGEDALVRWAAEAGRITAVVTDVRMPGMGGAELVDRLRAERPSLPVVFVSGYTGGALRPLHGPHEAFVEKPFSGDAILAAVARVLAAAGS